MVWCPKHNRYVKGRNGRQYHIDKFDCDFIREHMPNRKELPKYNHRNNGEDNADHKTNYMWKRERRKRSTYRTQIKKKGR